MGGRGRWGQSFGGQWNVPDLHGGGGPIVQMHEPHTEKGTSMQKYEINHCYLAMTTVLFKLVLFILRITFQTQVKQKATNTNVSPGLHSPIFFKFPLSVDSPLHSLHSIISCSDFFILYVLFLKYYHGCPIAP